MAKSAYIGSSSVSHKIKSIYVGVSSVARKVVSAYVGVSNSARKFWPKEPEISTIKTVSVSGYSLNVDQASKRDEATTDNYISAASGWNQDSESCIVFLHRTSGVATYLSYKDLSDWEIFQWDANAYTLFSLENRVYYCGVDNDGSDVILGAINNSLVSQSVSTLNSTNGVASSAGAAAFRSYNCAYIRCGARLAKISSSGTVSYISNDDAGMTDGAIIYVGSNYVVFPDTIRSNVSYAINNNGVAVSVSIDYATINNRSSLCGVSSRVQPNNGVTLIGVHTVNNDNRIVIINSNLTSGYTSISDDTRSYYGQFIANGSTYFEYARRENSLSNSDTLTTFYEFTSDGVLSSNTVTYRMALRNTSSYNFATFCDNVLYYCECFNNNELVYYTIEF